MSMFSKLVGSDARKRNARKFDTAGRAAAAAGDGDAFKAAINDYSRTLQRVNMQSGLKGAGLVAGGALLAGGGGAAGAGGSSAINAGGAAGGAGQAAGGAALKSAGGSSFLGGAGNFLRNNPELILGGIQAFQGSREQAKANEMQKRALALAEQPWNETAGLRKQSLDQMMNPQTPDLSSIYSGSSNPFARQVPPSGFSRLRSVGG